MDAAVGILNIVRRLIRLADSFPEGSLAFEPRRSTHTPMTRHGEVADVLVIPTADNGAGNLLEVHLDNGDRLHLDLHLMEAMSKMSSQAEFRSFLAK